MKQMNEEAFEIGNFKKYKNVALPFIETMTDYKNISNYLNIIIEVKALDAQILTFFKNVSTFKNFVNYFTKRYNFISKSKEASKVIKEKFEVSLFLKERRSKV
nr:unnamed protein product [Meloidogyne enterolobii]